MADTEPLDNGMRYNHDDEVRERDGETGVEPRMFDEEAEVAARRSDLARRLEDIANEVLELAEITYDDDMREIYEALIDIYERVGNPPEYTDKSTPLDDDSYDDDEF